MLSEYFRPLSPLLLLISLGLFVYFDVLGVFIDKKFIKSPSFIRPAIWIYGVGAIVFEWFWLRFLIPIRPNYVLWSLVPLLIIALPSYIKNREWRSLTVFIKANLLSIMPILIFLPILLVKSSLPPYLTDEMQYHFLSPYETYNSTWKIDYESVHPSLPKELDLFFAIPFSLTKTYSPTRLLHFAIFYSSVSAIYAWFKSRTSHLSAFAFLWIFLFLNHDLLIVATSGYIDYSTAALTVLGMITMIEFILTKTANYLYASMVFSAMSIGSKYPSLVPFATSYTIFVVWLAYTAISFASTNNAGGARGRLALQGTASASTPDSAQTGKSREHWREGQLATGPAGKEESAKFVTRFSKILKPSSILKLISLLVFFGGFWYLKNLALTGNPIFPFLGNVFKCDQALCSVTNSIFGATIPISFSYLPQLAIGITKGHSIYLLLLIPALLLILKSRRLPTIKIALFLLSCSTLSFVVIKYFTGYVDRYFYFLQIVLALLLTIPLSLHSKSRSLKKLNKVYSVVLFLFAGYFFAFNVKRIYSLKSYISPQEIRYALGKTDIYDWLKDRHRVTGDIYKWCGTLGKKELFLADEDVIRKAEDGWTHIFNVNCELLPLDFYEATPMEELKHLVAENKMLYFADREKCRKPINLNISRKEDYSLYRLEIRNLLICNSSMIIKNLYLLNPQGT